MIKVVRLSKKAQRNLLQVPNYIKNNVLLWIQSIEELGLEEVRKIPGFHDEPLKGNRLGQRSIRLNRSYRAIYIVQSNGDVELVEVIEVNKHAY
ncbi:type II toxin-antitoxin system mRNA interferase toxin, RelE/StbE family [Bdellovibrio svalbardensis]|uniref:Type II toxin-antitoxin system mRNA interferase toxin, RelE/StbE family n=1 Tax=Bdellovibrio svalbardensis TaxID=2972972 RepID=A0ABT6DIT3_9BACT|nr:type II toxin-antitoxin system mRNA interferase toxin, RelE/StbE family [Bdellovibrio svalbardensis]MDG0816429.1 type II toxin-antitoxin system mRNA interferase toxin, RelE/StbE family [Bdellovibrio svalbardensis]